MAELRRLWSRPTVAAEWDEEHEERSAQWWELFLDLVIVAAVANVADGLKETLEGTPGAEVRVGISVFDFIMEFSLFFTGWLEYTLHTTRFLDTSFLHSLLLFGFFLGTSGMVVNAGTSEAYRGFAIGVIFQRLALMVMTLVVYMLLPRGRHQALVDAGHMLPTIIILSFALCFNASDVVFQVLLGISATYEVIFPLMEHLGHLSTRSGVPINKDHIQERLGCMLMVILGESVMSSVMSYHKVSHKPSAYYSGMALTLTITFAVAVMYFAVVPPKEFSAFRRSTITGVSLVVAHWVLFLSLTALGVGIKLYIAVILERDEDILLDAPCYLILFISLGIAIGSMLVMRLLHWWGRQPAPSDPIYIRRAKYIWWFGLVISTPLPWIVASITIGRHPQGVEPFGALWQAVGCIFGAVVFESTMLHWLDAQGFGSFIDAPLNEASPLLSNTSPVGG
mmetsp:Transcript_21397/g.41955  ORF Transcript_21397/g.41955 Transcript_21397/m.41955 type:complete len:452 (+) Transcript_21397:202-1557(+)